MSLAWKIAGERDGEEDMQAVMSVLLGVQGDAYRLCPQFLCCQADFTAASCLQRGVSFWDGNTTHQVWKASGFYHESR